MTLTPEQMTEIEKRHERCDVPENTSTQAELEFEFKLAHKDRAQLLAHARDLERQLYERRAADREKLAIEMCTVYERNGALPWQALKSKQREIYYECADAIIALQSTPPEGAK